MIRVVCIDLMGTLIYDPYVEALEAATGLGVQDAHLVKDPSSWPDFEMGLIDERTFVARFFADPEGGHAFDLEAFHRTRREGYRFLPGMRELLLELEGVVERYVATNYPIWVEELREAFRLDELSEGLVASHYLGVRKPDPAFYERLAAAVGRAAGECLFVDDRERNCRAALAAGMLAHVFTDADDLRARLRAEGVAV